MEKRLSRTVDDVLGASPLALAEVEDTDAGVRRSSDAERPATRGTYRCRVGSPTLSEVRQRKGEIEDVARRHGAHNVRVFGSVAQGGQRPGSDVDFLVDLEEDRGLFDLGGLLMDLRDLLGCDVDVVTQPGLPPRGGRACPGRRCRVVGPDAP